MARGDRKPEGNEEQFPSGFPSPQAFNVWPLDDSNTRQGG
jgi:hypothetical protein